jgi:hypothetical protein
MTARKKMPDADRARQLDLFSDLHCTNEPPPAPPLDDPQPSAERRSNNENGENAGRLIHATADTRPGVSFAGVLHAHGELLWRCQHVHRSPDGALVCAWRERRVRLDLFSDRRSPKEPPPAVAEED